MASFLQVTYTQLKNEKTLEGYCISPQKRNGQNKTYLLQ